MVKQKILLLFLMFSTITYSQTTLQQIRTLTLGKFIYDANISIRNDSIQIDIKVNNKGFCYAVDMVYVGKNERPDSKTVEKTVQTSNQWIYEYNYEELNRHETFKRSSSLISQRGLGHRYDGYYSHIIENNIKYIILGDVRECGALLSETTDLKNIDDRKYSLVKSKSIEETKNEENHNILLTEPTFKSEIEALEFLKSSTVIEKQKELIAIDNVEKERIAKIIATPVESIVLPYKFRFGMTILQVENHLISIGNKITKDKPSWSTENTSLTNYESYTIKNSEDSFFKLGVRFYNGKAFSFDYSHGGFHYNEELDKLLGIKIETLLSDYIGLLNGEDGSFNGNPSSIFVNKISNNVNELEEKLKVEIEEKKRDKKNSVGNKM